MVRWIWKWEYEEDSFFIAVFYQRKKATGSAESEQERGNVGSLRIKKKV